jgi:hypothetical protein
LRVLMDAWCAFWVWAPSNGTGLPTLDGWLEFAELLLGQPENGESGRLFAPAELDDGTLESVERFGRASLEEIHERHPWLVEIDRISRMHAFFHWELEHVPVFTKGGFDLTVGNPPWVRPTWDEPACLAEHDPWWGVTDLTRVNDTVQRARRAAILASSTTRDSYCQDRAETEGLNSLLGAPTREPLLAGLQTNLYMVFITNAWRRTRPNGTVGLLHPEGHFVDPKAGHFRSELYRRLRRHWHFENEGKLFADIGNTREFGVNIYGLERGPSFLQAVHLIDPATLDRSLSHDGEGELPGVQFPEGGWDTRPHAARIVTVDFEVLVHWVRLIDPPGTPPEYSRLVRPLTTADLDGLTVFAQQPTRLADAGSRWTRGFDEDKLKKEGTGVWRTEVPESLPDCILQGPHILNGTPFGQQPRSICKSNKDWDVVDLETLPPDYIPRTNYQRLVSPKEFVGRQAQWDGKPFTTRYREAHREFVDSSSVRTLQACILPPEVPHIGKVNSIWTNDNWSTVRWAGLLTSLPYDCLIKTSGINGVKKNITDALPVPAKSAKLDGALLLRTLRLNCLISAYAPLWSELFQPEWLEDKYVAGTGATTSLGDVERTWSELTPLRFDYDRWLALCEIDAVKSRRVVYEVVRCDSPRINPS